jgi:hypothetical protein
MTSVAHMRQKANVVLVVASPSHAIAEVAVEYIERICAT